MTDDRPRPKDAQLRWTLAGSLDVLHLSSICDEVHTYVCSGLPGSAITGIEFDGRELTITVGDSPSAGAPGG